MFVKSRERDKEANVKGTNKRNEGKSEDSKPEIILEKPTAE